MENHDIDYKSLVTVLLVSFFIGAGIDYFSDKVHWVTAGFGVLFAIWANGLFISLEDREPDGWDYVENESDESKRKFKKSFKIQVVLTILVFILGICSHILFGG